MPGVNTMSKGVSGFDPRSIPGCMLWLDGQDPLFTGTKPANGASVSTWKDKSGRGNDAVSAGTAPTYNSTSNSIVFNATGCYSNISASLPLVNRSVFILANQTSSSVSGFEGILSFASGAINDYNSSNSISYTGRGSNAGQNASFGVYANNGDYLISYLTYTTPVQYYIYSDIYASNSGTLYVNSSNIATDTTANPVGTATGFVVGGRYLGGVNYGSGLGLNGVISEIIAFSNTLTTTQRQAVEGYLAWKWGLEISASFLPSSIPTPLMWFDAADSSTLTLSGTGVTQWRDKISNFTVTPSNAGYPPTRSGNGIYFNNVSPNISGTSIVLYSGTTWTLPTQTNSVFTVCAPDRLAGANEYRAIFNLQTPGSVAPNTFIMTQVASPNKEGNYYELDFNGTNWNLDYVGSPFATTLGQPRIDTIIGVPGATKLYTNNIENSYMASNFQGRALQTNVPIQNTIIASGAGNRVFSGTIYEILVYSGAVTELQRQTIQGYLASKWNVANIPTSVLPTTHPFVQLRPTLRSFAPIDIPNCILWLDGGDASTVATSGANVTGWVDKSGRGNNVTTISSTPPTYSSSAGAITFTCTSQQYLWGNLDALYSASGATTFIVGSLTSNASATGTVRILVLGSNDTVDNSLVGQLNVMRQLNPSPILTTFLATNDNPTNYATNLQTALVTSYNTRYIFTNASTYDGTNFTINTFLYGNTQTNSSRTFTYTLGGGYTANYNKYSIGTFLNVVGAATNCYNGDINEVITFSRQLTTIERQTIEGYLAWKWNLSQSQPNTAPYYRIPPSIALPFSPLAISGCSSWIDALDISRMVFYPGTSKIQTYIDKTSNFSYSNFQGTSTYAPLFQSNGFYCVNGTQTTNGTDGQEQQLRFSSIPNLNISRLTLVILCKPDFLKATNLYANPATLGSGVPLLSALTPVQNTQPGGFPTEWFVDYNSGPSGSYFSLNNTSVTTTPSILVMTSGTTGGSLFTNGTLSGSVSWTNYTSPNTVTYELQLPCASTRGWTGYMYEAFVYNKVLSTTERQQIEGYLAAKWNIQSVLPSTHPFKKFSPGM